MPLFTCRINGIDPCTWPVDVLQRVSVHPANRAAELTPHLWRKYVTSNPMRSDPGTGQVAQPARARGSPGGIWLRCRKAGSCRSISPFRLSVLTACNACAPELSGNGIPGSTEKEHVAEWPLTREGRAEEVDALVAEVRVFHESLRSGACD